MLAHIVYKSRCRTGTTMKELEELRRHFSEPNKLNDVTGLLLCDGVYFMQLLEGKRRVLERLYQNILADQRHEDVTTLLSAPVPKRIFAGFGMHLVITTPGHWIDPQELAPLFLHGVEGSVEDRTHALLRAFTSGRWRERTVPRQLFTPAHDSLAVEADLPRLVSFDDELCPFAFQPIVNPVTRQITGVEALMRGKYGEAPHDVMGRLRGHDLHSFDLHSKASAFSLARRLGIRHPLSINLLPSSLLATDNAAEVLLTDARRHGFGPKDFIVEITEEEAIGNPSEFLRATDALRAAGISMAIDDFGAGFAGLSLLATFQPDRIKIDMTLVRGVDKDGPRQAILRAIVDCCVSLGIKLVCEGVETEAELRWLLEHDIYDFQGFLFARPLLAGLPAIAWPALGDARQSNDLAPVPFDYVRRSNTVPAPTPDEIKAAVSDPVRLEAVRALNLLDTAREPEFDRWTRMAAKLTNAPVAFVALVDEHRDFYKAAHGFGEPLASVRQLEGRTFCHYAVASGSPLILEDVTAQDVFRDVPTVQTLGIRAYAGIPLVTSTGEVIGSFCAVDFQSRRWSETDITVLTEIALAMMREIELHALQLKLAAP